MTNEITKYTITLTDGSQVIYTLDKPNNSFVSLYNSKGKFVKNTLIKEAEFENVKHLLEKSIIK